MAAPYSDIADIQNLVQTAYDRHTYLALRAIPQFRAIADTKPVAQSMPGNSVVFNIHQDLDPVTTPLSGADPIDGSVDPVGVSLNNTTPVTVRLLEYGNFTVVTKAVQLFNLDNAFDPQVADILAYNQADSVDRVVEAVLATGTNNIFVNGGSLLTGTGDADAVTGTDLITSGAVRLAVAKLRGANVLPVDGMNFVSYIHPNVALDLMSETDPAGWRLPQVYGAGDGLTGVFAGELGTYQGVRFIETPRASATPNTNDVNVYNTYIVGKGALAEAVAEEFHTVIDGTVVDPLNRKSPIGWYGVAGWSLFRPAALWIIKTASSVDAAA